MAALGSSLLVLGTGGQLGHVVARYLLAEFPHEVFLQARQATGIRHLDEHLTILDAKDSNAFLKWIDTLRPVVIINCIARKISLGDATPIDLTYLNSDFPRLLALHLDGEADGSRLIQISSDGVFNGQRGSYSELDLPDADDPYGRSKAHGEVHHGPHLTIRTSFVGHSISSRSGLLDWLLGSDGPVIGHRQTFWNGLSSLELARFVAHAAQIRLSGLIHVHGERISKYTLLKWMADAYEKRIEITPSDELRADRSLCSVRDDVHWTVPKTETMLREYRNWHADQLKLSA